MNKSAKILNNKQKIFMHFTAEFFITALIVLFLVLSLINTGYAQQRPEIRELDSDFLNIDENIIDPEKDLIYSSDKVMENSGNYRDEKEIIKAPTLKGGISELRAIVGKSQIIRFDEPVRRISITKPELVDMIFLSPGEIIMNGKMGGETTVIIWGEHKDPVFFNLFVENNNLNFVKEVKKIAPNERIEIDFIDTGTDSGLKVVLSGKISSSIIKSKIDKIAEAYGYSIVDLTETLEPQVMLEVRLVELNKSKGKKKNYEFKQGVLEYVDHIESVSNTDFTIENFPDGSGGTETRGEGDSDDSLIDELVLKKMPSNLLRGYSFTGGLFKFWKAFPDQELSYVLNMAESEGLIKVISEPRVMVVNGESASFTSGSEVPIPSGVDELGNQQYEYTSVGTTINITPNILEESERILLDITASISEIDSAISTTTGPGFNTRNGQTKVEIANNHTTVITGLMRKSETKTRDKFPFLSNLPVIGELFDSVTASSDETELMIFVTASIVKADLARGQ